MNVHLFGATSSPGCTNLALQTAANDGGNDLGEEAASFVKTNSYVDDGLKSIPTVQEAIKLIKNSTELWMRGSFRLHKFTSNSREGVELVPIASQVQTLWSTSPQTHTWRRMEHWKQHIQLPHHPQGQTTHQAWYSVDSELHIIPTRPHHSISAKRENNTATSLQGKCRLGRLIHQRTLSLHMQTWPSAPDVQWQRVKLHWERKIWTTRSVLSALLEKNGQQVNYEALQTFMCEAEAIVNSRP